MTRLSETPLVHATANVVDSSLGRYTEVGAGCAIAHSTLGDYSYCVENTQIAYATIGKFANIAAHVRIYASMHPMERASLHHFSYRSAWYFDGESDDQDFFDWRAGQGITIGHDTWIGHAPGGDAPESDHRQMAPSCAPTPRGLVTRDCRQFFAIARLRAARTIRQRYSRDDIASRLDARSPGDCGMRGLPRGSCRFPVAAGSRHSWRGATAWLGSRPATFLKDHSLRAAKRLCFQP